MLLKLNDSLFFFAIKDSTISLVAHIIYIIYTHLVSSRKLVVG